MPLPIPPPPMPPPAAPEASMKCQQCPYDMSPGWGVLGDYSLCEYCGYMAPTERAPASATLVDAVDPHLGARERGPRAPQESTETGLNMGQAHHVETLLPCVKCGSTDGWRGPRYKAYQVIVLGAGEQPGQVGAWLEYACLTCGYQRRAPTKDTPPAPLTTELRGRPGTTDVQSRPTPRAVPPVPRCAPVPAFDRNQDASPWLWRLIAILVGLLAIIVFCGWHFFILYRMPPQ